MSQTDQSQLAFSKRVGERVEATLIQRHALRHVADTEVAWHDAAADGLLEPSAELPFVGVVLVEADTPIEIKSAAVVTGERQRRGRFQLREQQHAQLLDAGAMYCFAVGDPSPDREVLAAKIVPATGVDELVTSWIETADREPYPQIPWSHVFDPEEVQDV